MQRNVLALAAGLALALPALAQPTAASASDLEAVLSQPEAYVGGPRLEARLKKQIDYVLGSPMTLERFGVKIRDPFSVNAFASKIKTAAKQRGEALGEPLPLPTLLKIKAKFPVIRRAYSFDDQALIIGPVFKSEAYQVKNSISAYAYWPLSIPACLFVDLSGQLADVDLGSPGVFAAHLFGEKLSRLKISPEETLALLGEGASKELSGEVLYRLQKPLQSYGSSVCGEGLVFELTPVSYTIHGFPSGSKTATQFFWGKGN
ncbi:hypothetical protein [Paucibacter sp. KBW04]|uniref:hypothetical protein n=1 Tax=Paucibacter sp. KBW04 TaxID=2153361 RepID=UPI000F5621BD|nr:hypothetical protein [Paucibacter sp. KBW04]